MEKVEILLKSYKESPVNVNLNNVSTMKLALKDIMGQYLSIVAQKEDHSFTDLKLFSGLISTILGCIICYFSINFPFDEYRNLLILGVSLYMLLNITIPFYEEFIKGKVVFKGIFKNNIKISFFMVDKKYDEFIKIRILTNNIKKEFLTLKLKNLFYDNGDLNAERFVAELKKKID